MKKAALYSRVSTIEQANNGYSLNAQKEQLENYAKAMNYHIVDQYSDGGNSGGNMERPELKRMINDIERGLIDVVIVVKLDRLSRNQRNTLYLIEDVFQKNNAGFISLQESFDTTTSFGRAMVGIISTFAQLERDTIYERMFMGRKERAKKGLYSGSANVAAGYSYVDGRLVKNEFSDVIVEIFERYVDGESAYAIYTDLIKQYPTFIYSSNMIMRILDNPIYIGNVKFDGEIYKGEHEPIVSEELFSQAQKRRKKISNKYTVDKSKRSALLARKLYCGHCGKSLVKQNYYSKHEGKFVTSEYHYGYYVCNGKRSRYTKKYGKKCIQKNLKVQDVDNLVIDNIISLNLNKASENITKRRKTNNIKNKIDNLEVQEKRLMDLYQIGSVDINELDSRLKEIRKERAQLKETKGSSLEKKVVKTLKRLNEVDMHGLSFEEQCEIIDTLIDNIVVTDKEIKITYNF